MKITIIWAHLVNVLPFTVCFFAGSDFKRKGQSHIQDLIAQILGNIRWILALVSPILPSLQLRKLMIVR